MQGRAIRVRTGILHSRESLGVALKAAVCLILLVCGLLAVSFHLISSGAFLIAYPAILGGAMLVELIAHGKNMLSIVFVIYIMLVFLLAYAFFDESLKAEGGILFLIVAFSFLVGRSVSGIDFPLRLSPPLLHQSQESAGAAGTRILYIGIAIRLVCTFLTISQYGLGQFFSGAYLATEIGEYDAAAGLGAVSIVSQFGTLLCIVGIATSLHTARFQKRATIFVLVILPLLTLQRGAVASGALCLAYIFRDRLKLRHFVSIAAMVVLIAILFGSLRARNLTSSSQSSTSSRSGLGLASSAPLLVIGELSVSQAIHQVLLLTHEQGLGYGSTLLGPTLTAEIPRSLIPWKPPLTAAVIMERYDPRSAANGFFLAVTVFGDWLYNFGYAGLVLICFALGWVIAKLDKAPVNSLGIIFTFYYYPLLRDGFPRAICSISLCLMIMWALRLNWKERGIKSPNAAVSSG
jgi:oligosaccharide repeat unit polymerase